MQIHQISNALSREDVPLDVGGRCEEKNKFASAADNLAVGAPRGL